MKRGSINSLLTLGFAMLSLAANAENPENFNSRNNIPARQVKALLQEQCWIFRDFEINRNGWNPGIDGDGAMVSGTASKPDATTAIFTPLVQVNNSLTVSFDYKFNTPLTIGASRKLTVAIADYNGNIVRELDNTVFTEVSTDLALHYSKSFNDLEPGAYKLMIAYAGNNGNTRIAVDNVLLDAELVFNNGCKTAPVAIADRFIAQRGHKVQGNLLLNDAPGTAGRSAAYAVTASNEGNVTINSDGSFEFIPNADFKGSTASFTYKLCDLDYAPLCSDDAKVTIQYVAGPLAGNEEILPQSLTEFKGFYQEDGKVEIKWVTNFEQNSDRFEVERSFDGKNWITAGSMKAKGKSENKQPYSFVDKLGRNTVHKNDLYYRLRQVNLDSKSSVSKILVVRVFNKRALRMVSVTPNPVKNDISVNVQLNENSFVVMKIVNNEGNEMMRKAQRVEEGQSSFVMDGSNKLTPGMYFLEVTVNSKDRMVAKLLKE